MGDADLVQEFFHLSHRAVLGEKFVADNQRILAPQHPNLLGEFF